MRAPTESELAGTACFHCGETVPAGVNFSVEIDGADRAMCCPGCRAVAQLIASNGLDRFYTQRTAFNERPADASPPDTEQYLIYDEQELAQEFSAPDDTGCFTASLLLGGISCAACTWLIEQSLLGIEGVHSAVVNLQQAKLDVRFDPAKIPLSEIFIKIAQLGYEPRPFRASTQRTQLQKDRRRDLRRLAIAGLGMMQVGMFAVALHAGDMQGIDERYQALLRWVSLPVAALVVWYSARVFFSAAWRHLRQGSLVMDLPVSLAIGLAFTASVWATLTGSGDVYFDSVVMFTFFLLLARFLESGMRQRHMFDLVDAENALPDSISIRRDDSWVNTPRIRAASGDIVLVNTGETVPVDGNVVDGASAVREDAFNGEHLPRQVANGDSVYAGTINVDAALQIQVAGDYAQSRLATLQRSVEIAQTEKPRLAQISDRIASWFVAGILLVSAITCTAWLFTEPDRALWVTLSVLVVSCPCALALATPAALTSAAAALRRQGVLVRGENAIESLSRCSHLLFDKTGTLTEGHLSINRAVSLDGTPDARILACAAALQQHSNHPIARAFSNTTATEGFTDVTYEIGAGLSGVHDGHSYRLGSIAFCRQAAVDFPDAPDEALYWIGMTRDSTPIAMIGLDDHLRDDAPTLLQQVRKQGLHTQLVTGDPSAQGPALARQLNMGEVHRGLSPQDKMQHVQALQAQGAIVGMVGDGLNDAPVLSLANASFAVTGATDLARAQADFVICDGGLGKITLTMRKARQCLAIMYQNFAWALAYNLCAIPLAAMGFIPPWAAALGMSLSSLLVVANSLRLNR